MVQQIDTGRVTDRRKLRFNTVEEVLSEIDRIVQAEKAGTLKQLGNWTSGQVFGHLAAWLQYAYEGFPIGPPPFFIRWFLKMRRGKYLREGLPAGVRIPRLENGTLATDVLTIDEGADRFRRALTRLQAHENPKHDSPALGRLSFDEFLQLNLRHAELHMSFLKY